MAQRINRAIELLAQDQAIYYTGGHSGHVLTRAQGREDAHTWADYINVGMEHGAFDMTGLGEYMEGLVEGGPTRSGHRTPTVIVEALVNGTDAANVRFNAWQFRREILGRGVHGVLLCQAESADAVRAFVNRAVIRITARAPTLPCPPRSSGCADQCVTQIVAGSGSARVGAVPRRPPRQSGGSRPKNTPNAEPVAPIDPAGELLLGVKLKSRRASPIARRSSPSRAWALPSWGRAILAFRWAMSQSRASLIPPRCAKHASGCLPPAATIGSRFSRPARPRTLLRSLTRACGSLPDIARKPPRSVAPTSAAQCPSELPPGAAAPLFAAPTLSGRRRTAETCLSGPVSFILLDLGRAFVQGKTILVPADFR